MNSVHNDLSVQSKTFLEDLRVYLFSSGKNTEEIDDIVDQLEVHLIDAEKNGKSISKIIGDSPKEYMNQLANEMPTDYKAWSKYLPIIVLGGFSITIFGDLIEGNLSYSILELLGYLAIALTFIVLIFGAFKYISGRRFSSWKQMMILTPIPLINMGLFISLIYLNQTIETPTIHFGSTGSIIVACLAFVFLVAASWWAKTGVLLIILLLLYLPAYLISFSILQETTQLLVSTLITFAGIAIYLFITFKQLNRE